MSLRGHWCGWMWGGSDSSFRYVFFSPFSLYFDTSGTNEEQSFIQRLSAWFSFLPTCHCHFFFFLYFLYFLSYYTIFFLSFFLSFSTFHLPFLPSTRSHVSLALRFPHGLVWWVMLWSLILNYVLFSYPYHLLFILFLVTVDRKIKRSRKKKGKKKKKEGI